MMNWRYEKNYTYSHNDTRPDTDIINLDVREKKKSRWKEAASKRRTMLHEKTIKNVYFKNREINIM